MKTMVRVSLMVLLVMGVVLSTLASPVEEVSVVPSKYKNLFVFKIDKQYVGATVEVYYSNGDLVAAQKIKKRKMIIDFCDTKFGEYTIRVVKGDKKQEFYYVKK
jgi:hypothetical protein